MAGLWKVHLRKSGGTIKDLTVTPVIQHVKLQ